MRALAIAATVWLTIGCALAAEPAGRIIPADVIEVLDGDSFRVRAYPWPSIEVVVIVRLSGIDTPELDGDCEQEEALAQQAKAVLAKLLPPRVLLTELRPDKFGGRVLAVVAIDGRNLGDTLVSTGLAQRWNGRGRAPEWCP